MKIFRIISHPVVLVISFLVMIISGEHLGGFYALYLLLGLMHGSIHSILGVFGVTAVLAYYSLQTRKGYEQLGNILGLAGALLMMASIFLFYYRDTSHYNYGSFSQALPMATLILFIICLISFLVNSLYLKRKRVGPNLHGVL